MVFLDILSNGNILWFLLSYSKLKIVILLYQKKKIVILIIIFELKKINTLNGASF